MQNCKRGDNAIKSLNGARKTAKDAKTRSNPRTAHAKLQKRRKRDQILERRMQNCKRGENAIKSLNGACKTAKEAKTRSNPRTAHAKVRKDRKRNKDAGRS